MYHKPFQYYIRREINGIVSWCDTPNLFLNVSTTEELMIDFRRNKTNKEPVSTNNKEVEQVSVFKLLCTFLCNNLSWHYNCNAFDFL